MKEAALKQLLETMRQENAAGHEETRRVLREENSATHEETRRVLREENALLHGETRTVLRQEMAKSVDDAKRVIRRENTIEHEKTRQLIDNFAQYFDEALRLARIQVKFLSESLTGFDRKVDRELADVRSEMRGGFAETQALMKFSHDNLDRRVTALEQASKNP
jgi:hypothetical protein